MTLTLALLVVAVAAAGVAAGVASRVRRRRRHLAPTEHGRDFTVLAVGRSDAYLNHVLRMHDVDIHHHQPDFAWSSNREDLQAYLVQEGDDTVGVVVLRLSDAEPGLAHVELDWVTPEFRDCSAGEYVWLRSDILRHRGITSIVTSPAMLNPYYAELGFERLGDAYVLRVPAATTLAVPAGPAGPAGPAPDRAAVGFAA